MNPNHVAIIMDGNGRWAKLRGLKRTEGHLKGSETLKELVEYAFSNGVKVLSVFAFSTENFNRSKVEVDFLMDLFIKKFNEYFYELHQKGIKVVFSKKDAGLPLKLESIIKDVTEKTKDNKNGIFNICINYGGQDEILDMTKKVCTKVINNELDINSITKEVISNNLYQDLPPIDLLIRTSGEYRISNFMLWQMAYAEFYFTDVLWPDFDEKELENAISAFNKRDRRYGGVKKK